MHNFYFLKLDRGLIVFFFLLSRSIAPIFGQFQLDQSFGDNGVVISNDEQTRRIRAIRVLSNEKILVVGLGKNEDNNNMVVGLKYHANGTLDTAFGENGKLRYEIEGNISPYSFIEGDDGSILILCIANASGRLVKFNENGSLDVSFGNNGFYEFPQSLVSEFFALEKDILGRYIVGGSVGDSALILALKQNGELDTSFGNGGIRTEGIDDFATVYSVVILNDNSILAGGTAYDNGGLFPNSYFFLTKYDGNGIKDESFGVSGSRFTDFHEYTADWCNKVIPMPNGDLVCGGGTSSSIHLLTRIDSLGNHNSNFAENGLAFNPTIPMHFQHGLIFYLNRIISCGTVATENGENQFAVVSLDENGSNISLDTIDLGTINDWAVCMTPAENGKLLIAGGSMPDGEKFRFSMCKVELFNNDIQYKEFPIHSELAIFPNPIESEGIVELNVPTWNEPIKLILQNVNGQVLLNKVIMPKESRSINIELNVGDYLYSIFDRKGTQLNSGRLIVINRN